MSPEAAGIAQWLSALSAARLVVLSPRLVLDVEALLRQLHHHSERDPAAYGYALASLLAKDEACWKQIAEHFQQYFGIRFPMPGTPSEMLDLRKIEILEPSKWAGYRSPPPSPPRGPAWLRRALQTVSAKTLAILLAIALVPLLFALPKSIEWLGSSAPDPQTAATEADAGAAPPEAEKTDAGIEDGGMDDAEDAGAKTPEARLELIQGPESHITRSIPPAAIANSPSILTWLHALFLVCSGLLGILGARLFFANRLYAEDIQKAERIAEIRRKELMEQVWEPGMLYHVEQAPPLTHAAIDDAATLLGRVTRREPGFELDVPATLERTIHAAGRIIPVHAPGRRPQPILILVDVEDGSHPYLEGVEYILARWKRLGVPFVRYDYAERPSPLLRHPDRRPITLEELARRNEDAPLLVFSRMIRPQDFRGRLDWTRGFDAWAVRAWIDLDPRERKERHPSGQRIFDRLQKRLPRYSFTREGLMDCASSLASRESKRKAPQSRPLLAESEIEEALQLWAATACCVPHPTWAQLDSLRRELPEICTKLPEARYIQRLLDWIRRQGMGEGEVGMGERLRIQREAQRGLVVWLRAWDARHFEGKPREMGVEYRTRQLLIRQLNAANVSGDAFERELRRMKKALHEAVLNPEDAQRLLDEFRQSAVAPELRKALEDEYAQQDLGGGVLGKGKWTRRMREVVQGFVKGREGVRLRDLGRLWRWNRVQILGGVGVIVGVLGSFGGLWRWGGPEVEAEELRVVMPAGYRVKPAEPPPVALADIAPMPFIRLPGGKFLMGSPKTEKDRDSDEKQHPAEVAGFEIAIHEVSQKQWTAVMGTKPFNCAYGCKDELPANGVSWEDALKFMNALTELDNKARSSDKKRTRCYDLEKKTWDRKCTGYRLPTEAEWEYAARAGTTTAYSFGEDAKELCKYGNVSKSVECDDGFENLAPVGSFKPNPWGLYDMHGNVWELVWDCHGDYPSSSSLGYAGVNDGKEYDNSVGRVLRGGSFLNKSRWLRSSIRSGNRSTLWYENVGFRCVRASITQP